VDALNRNPMDVIEPNADLVNEFKIAKCCNTFGNKGKPY
jgi:hypothetical protein